MQGTNGSCTQRLFDELEIRVIIGWNGDGFHFTGKYFLKKWHFRYILNEFYFLYLSVTSVCLIKAILLPRLVTSCVSCCIIVTGRVFLFSLLSSHLNITGWMSGWSSGGMLPLTAWTWEETVNKVTKRHLKVVKPFYMNIYGVMWPKLTN